MERHNHTGADDLRPLLKTKKITMKINLHHASAIISQLLVAEAHAQDDWRDSNKIVFATNKIITTINGLEVFIDDLDREYNHHLAQQKHIKANRMQDEDSDGTCSDALCPQCK